MGRALGRWVPRYPRAGGSQLVSHVFEVWVSDGGMGSLTCLIYSFVQKQCQTLFFWAPKSLQMVTAAMKLKDAYSLEGKL